MTWTGPQPVLFCCVDWQISSGWLPWYRFPVAEWQKIYHHDDTKYSCVASRVTSCSWMPRTVPESQVCVPHAGQKQSGTINCPGIGSTVLIMVKELSLTLGRIIKIVATRCHILRLKYNKFNFSWFSATDLTEGALTVQSEFLSFLLASWQDDWTGRQWQCK